MNSVFLEPEQIELLNILVEASRNVPKDKRQKFYVLHAMGETNSEMLHAGLPNGKHSAYPGDIDVLMANGFLLGSSDKYSISFDVSPQGYAYYKFLKSQTQQPFENVVKSVKAYIDSDNFITKYPVAYQKWREADDILWKSDSVQHLTTIGHLCREAMQEFANSLVAQYNPPNVDSDKSHDINRMGAVLIHRLSKLGETEKEFLDALMTYWKSISELAQRQEHGAQREKGNLVWEDGRRLVFQTLVVFYEFDKALSRMA